MWVRLMLLYVGCALHCPSSFSSDYNEESTMCGYLARAHNMRASIYFWRGEIKFWLFWYLIEVMLLAFGIDSVKLYNEISIETFCSNLVWCAVGSWMGIMYICLMVSRYKSLNSMVITGTFLIGIKWQSSSVLFCSYVIGMCLV